LLLSRQQIVCGVEECLDGLWHHRSPPILGCWAIDASGEGGLGVTT
jgi:hypothetical protein